MGKIMRHWGKKGFDDLSLDVHKNISQGEWTVARTYSDNELLTQKQPLDNNANIYTNWKERWQQRSSIFCTLKTIKNKIGQKEWVVSSSKPFSITQTLFFSRSFNFRYVIISVQILSKNNFIISCQIYYTLNFWER